MMTIRELARLHGLSRATLLYYDRIGLLRPTTRTASGYRQYDSDAQKRLTDICVYRSAGLSLESIAQLLDGPQTSEVEVLTARMHALARDIDRLRGQQRAIAELIAQSGNAPAKAFDKPAWVAILKAAGMGEAQMRDWHTAFETNAPEAHQAFLTWLGIEEAEIAHVRMASREVAAVG